MRYEYSTTDCTMYGRTLKSHNNRLPRPLKSPYSTTTNATTTTTASLPTPYPHHQSHRGSAYARVERLSRRTHPPVTHPIRLRRPPPTHQGSAQHAHSCSLGGRGVPCERPTAGWERGTRQDGEAGQSKLVLLRASGVRDTGDVEGVRPVPLGASGRRVGGGGDVYKRKAPRGWDSFLSSFLCI